MHVHFVTQQLETLMMGSAIANLSSASNWMVHGLMGFLLLSSSMATLLRMAPMQDHVGLNTLAC